MPIELPPRCARDYEPLSVLAEGGFGMVVRARQLSLDRPVALKLLLECHLTDEAVRARFVQEARVTASLVHPNIVALIDHDVEGGIPWIVYEFVAGLTLEQRAREETFTLATLLDAGLAIARALEAAHARGIIHRDIKPANVLVGAEGSFKVTDFGIARWEPGLRTGTGLLLGTPAYLAPEYIGRGTLAPSCDLYALGVVLFELATGELPFRDVSPMRLLERHLTAPVPDPRDRWPAMPAALADLVRALLEKEPERRPGSAGEVAHRLQELRDRLVGGESSPPRGARTRSAARGTGSASGRPRDDRTAARAGGPGPTAVAASPPDAERPVSRRLWRPGFAVLAIASIAAATLLAFGVQRPGPVTPVLAPWHRAPARTLLFELPEGAEGTWDIAVESQPPGERWTTRVSAGSPGVVEGVRAGRLLRSVATSSRGHAEQEVRTPPHVPIRRLLVNAGTKTVLVDFDHGEAPGLTVRLVPVSGRFPAIEAAARDPGVRHFHERFNGLELELDYRLEILAPGHWVTPVTRTVRLRKKDVDDELRKAREFFESRPEPSPGNILEDAQLATIPRVIGPEGIHDLEVLLHKAPLGGLLTKETNERARTLREPLFARALTARLLELRGRIGAREVPLIATAAGCRPDREDAARLLELAGEALALPEEALGNFPPDLWLPALARDLDTPEAYEMLLESSGKRVSPLSVAAELVRRGHPAVAGLDDAAWPKNFNQIVPALRDQPSDWDYLARKSRTPSRRIEKKWTHLEGEELRARMIEHGFEPRSPSAREALKALALSSAPDAARSLLAEWREAPRPASLWPLVIRGARPVDPPLSWVFTQREHREGFRAQTLLAMGVLEAELPAERLPAGSAMRTEEGRAALWALGNRPPARLPDAVLGSLDAEAEEVHFWALGRSPDPRAAERLAPVVERLRVAAADPGAGDGIYSRLAMGLWALGAAGRTPPELTGSPPVRGPAWYRSVVGLMARPLEGAVTFVMFPWVPVIRTGLVLEPGGEVAVRVAGRFLGGRQPQELHEGTLVPRSSGAPDASGPRPPTRHVVLRPRLICGAEGRKLDRPPSWKLMRIEYEPATDRPGPILLSPIEDFEGHVAEHHPLPPIGGFAFVELLVGR